MADERGPIDVWQDGEVWRARVGASGKVVTSRSRDEALYFCGWWDGRRELGAAITRHVEGGDDADNHCEGIEP